MAANDPTPEPSAVPPTAVFPSSMDVPSTRPQPTGPPPTDPQQRTLTWPGTAPPFWLSPGAEPIPGYWLTRRLGQGGFGEVWAADGPGGWAVALKFIPLAEKAAGIERQALQIVKNIRHPNLLTIFGTWEREGVFVIGMELADRTLLDRWREAQGDGADGIPRGELLRYAAAAA